MVGKILYSVKSVAARINCMFLLPIAFFYLEDIIFFTRLLDTVFLFIRDICKILEIPEGVLLGGKRKRIGLQVFLDFPWLPC